MKIFISHAVADSVIAKAFYTFLGTGMGAPPNLIFFSSQPGSIENGEYFVKTIMDNLSDAELVIGLLSRDYLKSQFCMAELGAARMAAHNNPDRRFFPFLIPPLEHNEVGGMLHGVQGAKITDQVVLYELRDAVEKVKGNAGMQIPQNNWLTPLNEFEQTARDHVQHVQSPVGTQPAVEFVGVDSETSTDPNLVYKRKIHFYFENTTDDLLNAGPCYWKANLPLQKEHHPLKIKITVNGRWSDDCDGPVTVQPHARFRAWIALDQSVKDSFIFKLAAEKKLGVLTMNLTHAGIKKQQVFNF